MATKMPLERVQGRADVPKYTCFFHPDYNRRLGFSPIMPCGSQTIGIIAPYTAGGDFHSALKQN